MSYYDVSVVVDGVLERDEIAPGDDALNKLLDAIREGEREYAERATLRGVTTEVYVLHHPHAIGVECECIQYATDHHPAMVLRDGVEVNPNV